jgi:hypothetical protein
MAFGDNVVEILREIRDEIRSVRTEVQGLRIDGNVSCEGVRSDIRALRNEAAERFGMVETALLDLVEHHGFVVRYTRAIAERDTHLERMSALEARVDKLEAK